MQIIFVQFIFKFVTMNSPKLLLARLYSTGQNIKIPKNHYDTLKIMPHATQSEIKSAYYKLTLQYHPDKNKSEYAKQKFQDISDAYEVLSNHELRKNYDRHMVIHQQPISNVQESVSRYRDNVYSGRSKIYNFDKWTQAHYGREFYASRIRRNMYQQQKSVENMYSSYKQGPEYLEIALLLLAITTLALYFQQNYDQPVSKVQKYTQESEINKN